MRAPDVCSIRTLAQLVVADSGQSTGARVTSPGDHHDGVHHQCLGTLALVLAHRGVLGQTLDLVERSPFGERRRRDAVRARRRRHVARQVAHATPAGCGTRTWPHDRSGPCGGGRSSPRRSPTGRDEPPPPPAPPSSRQALRLQSTDASRPPSRVTSSSLQTPPVYRPCLDTGDEPLPHLGERPLRDPP